MTGVGGALVGCAKIAIVSFVVVFAVAFILGEFPDQSNKETVPLPRAYQKGALKTSPTPSPAEKSAKVDPPPLRTILPSLPTAVRTWESADGRKTLGSVTEIEVDDETVSLRLADGQEFHDYPIKNFSEDGQVFLLGRKVAKTE